MEGYTIQTIELTKRFVRRLIGKSITAVDHVNLEVKRGEILGILGKNGAGKTTLLKMICGLVRPTEGQVIINGIPFEESPSQVLSSIGAVLEGSRNSLWSMTVRQNITYFGYLKNVHGPILKQRAMDLLMLFQLEDKQNELVKNLSKGMKQKLAIALAFINDPKVVLLDEPTLGLDVQTERIVRDLVVRLTKKDNKTVLLSTHDMRLVEDICDRVAIIHKGRLIALGKTKDLLQGIQHEKYLIRVDGNFTLEAVRDLEAIDFIQEAYISPDEERCVIKVVMKDHNALFAVIEELRRKDKKILSITRSKPTLEEFFVNLVKS